MKNPDKKKTYIKPEVIRHPRIQRKDPFESFLGFIDQRDERKEANAEQIKEMDSRLINLGKLFGDSRVRWHLDGALNISLLGKTNKYIGVHKDVDISVEKSDLAELDKQLMKIGYGLFISHHQDRENLTEENLERADPETAAKDNEHLTIAAIDKKGKVVEGKILNFVDLHLIKRNSKGQPLGYGEVVFPEEWLTPQAIEFKGQKINVSNPAKVLYYKLHQTRSYDKTDSRILIQTGQVSEHHLSQIEAVINQEIITRMQMIDKLLSEITPEIKPGMTAENIFDVMIKNPMIADKVEHFKDQIMQISRQISEKYNGEPEQIKNIFFDVLKVKNVNDEMLAKLAELQQIYNDGTKIRNL